MSRREEADLGAAHIEAAVFSLPPERFLNACIEAIGLTGDELSHAERESMIGLLYRGAARIDLIEVLRSRRNPAVSKEDPVQVLTTVLESTPDSVLLDTMIRVFPGDHEAFIEYVFRRILLRAPGGDEKSKIESELERGGAGCRAALIERLVAVAWRLGRAVHLVSLSGPAGVVDSPANSGWDKKGIVVLCERRADLGGWDFHPSFLRYQTVEQANTMQISPGWVFTGPKRTLESGLWRLEMDIVQHDLGLLEVSVVANGGLSKLLKIPVMGSFSGSLAIEVGPTHHFLEIQVYKPMQEPALCWLNPQLIRLVRIRGSNVS